MGGTAACTWLVGGLVRHSRAIVLGKCPRGLCKGTKVRGFVLTHTNNLPLLVDNLLGNGLGLLKVVTGWGVPNGWSDATRRQAARVPALIVRTVQGDGKRLDPNKALDELRPWHEVRRDLMIEIGNEPNAPGAGIASDKEIWEYRYNLVETIKRVRSEMPQARVILPGLMTGDGLDRWLSILGDVVPLVDYIGLHAYEWYSFDQPGTRQLQTSLNAARQLCKAYTHKPIIFTEIGINDTKSTPTVAKLRRYRELTALLPGNVAAYCAYHICDNPTDDDQRAYAIAPSLVAHLR